MALDPLLIQSAPVVSSPVVDELPLDLPAPAMRVRSEVEAADEDETEEELEPRSFEPMSVLERGASLVPMTNPGKKGMTALAGPLEKRCKPAGEWNRYVITARDHSIELAVNGKVVTRAKETSQAKGYIGLQAEHSEIHFRNIRIRPLGSSDSPIERVDRAC